MDNDLIDHDELAVYLKVKKGTIYAKVSRREIPFIRISGRLVRFSKRAIDAWLEELAKKGGAR